MSARSLVKLSRLIVFAPAAVIAFSTPASADTFTENFDDTTYDLSVQLGGGAFWCDTYSSQYGTSGPSLCLFSTQGPTVFTFPTSVQVQGFEFVAGAKNGTTQLTAFYNDGTVGETAIDGTCCLATVSVLADEGKSITGFSIPADWDLWLFDSLSWFGESPSPTTTLSTVPPTSAQPTSTLQETTTTSSSTSTTSSTVAAEVLPPPPPDTTTTEVSTTTSSIPETTTTVPVVSTIANTTTIPPTTTTEVPSTTTKSPQTSVEAPISVEITPPVGDTVPIDQPPVNASEEEKLEFEAQVDIFSGEYDTYVPVGSKISVAQRRTVVAVTAVMIMFAPPPSRMRRK